MAVFFCTLAASPSLQTRWPAALAPAACDDAMTTFGWMPGVTIKNSPNYMAGRAGQRVKAVVLHVTAGKRGEEYPNAVSWLCNPQSQASAHFVISQKGEITQLVSILNEAWSNGLSWDKNRGRWIDPEGVAVTPSWTGLVIPINPNLVTISLEHACQPHDVWSPAMFDANTRVLQWIRAQTGLVYTPHRSLIGHMEISPVNRPNCPGPNVNYEKCAAAGNGTPISLRKFRVETAGKAVIRQGPGTQYPQAGILNPGDVITVDVMKTGESIQGNDQWAHMAKTTTQNDSGFVTMTVLKEVVS